MINWKNENLSPFCHEKDGKKLIKIDDRFKRTKRQKNIYF